MEMNELIKVAMVLLLIGVSQATQAVNPSSKEMQTARRWAAAKFEGIVEAPKAEPGLEVLANHDVVQRNSRAGRPLNIAGTLYERGLYCHAVSKVIVRLPGPGKTFSAFVGVDSNDQTSGGRGSVVFSVRNRDKEEFNSGVIREGHPPMPVAVALDGSWAFALEVGDAGDGISCDQSDWADAKVVLKDGSEVWLGDMPIIQGPRGMPTAEPPFSFSYDGKLCDLSPWKVKRSSKKLSNGTQYTTTYDDSKTNLQVRCVALAYADFPTVEWTVYFKNNGKADTPILSDLRAMDTVFQRSGNEEFVLHHHVGSICAPNDYQPIDDTLTAGTSKRITTSGGRSSNSDLPYFNVDWNREGVIMAIGWPGQWAADFVRDDAIGLAVRSGQELTHFKLHPGEEVRTPMIALQFWQGDRTHAQNVWRQWMMQENFPKPYGKPVAPQAAGCSSHQFGEMIHANEENQKLFVDRYLEEGIKLDYWWMDAGWYVNKTGWPHTGTWEVDTNRFPGGLRAITDHAHAKGVKSIVWFEPERVTPDTWLYDAHPEWLLGNDGEQKLLNLGNPDALKWLTEHVDKLIKEQGIDLYRNDFNIDPLGFWRANDPEDRQGITEIRYVQGFLAFWDELRKRHPDMLIDTCASGGRRNDVETLRRSVPLLRSDYLLEPTSQQCHTYGIASWIPFYGTGINQFDAYAFRSCACPGINLCYDMRKTDSDYPAARKLVDEWRQVGKYYLGDYYPLTPYSLENDVWMAFQFDRPDLDEGMVLAFRRPGSVYESARFKLQGLDVESKYSANNLDTGESIQVSGKELSENGLAVELKNQPDSAVITYKRL